MKEIKLIGTIEEVYEKLRAHVGKKICQYGHSNRYESTLIEVNGIDGEYICIRTNPLGEYEYRHGIAPPFFLCLEEDEVFETFDEMVRRKQEEIFWSLK